MSNLQLSLKKQWFDLTKSGEKTEDYRELTPYWCNRLMTFDGEIKPKKFWGSIALGFSKGYFYDRANFQKFDSNVMTLGYPKSTDSDRILKLEHIGIEIRTGNPKWGAEHKKIYLVIMHGSFLQ